MAFKAQTLMQNPCLNAAVVHAVVTVAQCVVDKNPRVNLQSIEVLVGAIQLPHTNFLSGGNPGGNTHWEKLEAIQIRIPQLFPIWGKTDKDNWKCVRPEYNIAILRLNRAISDKVVTTKGPNPAVTFAPLGDTHLQQEICWHVPLCFVQYDHSYSMVQCPSQPNQCHDALKYLKGW